MTNLVKNDKILCSNHRLDKNGGKFSVPKRENKDLIDFLMMNTQEVLDTFSNLPNAQKVGEGDKQFVYVPGTHENKALLVAHADTVWDDKELKLGVYGEELFSTNQGVGIGADDRAGIAMLWELKELGHSLLIPNKEEKGCVGSRFLMTHEEWRKVINTHSFAIEFDRRGDKDLVFYQVGSREYIDWCEKNFEGFKFSHGSFTDICVLCDEDIHKEDCLTGLNISIGYYDQHNNTEYLNLKEWANTLDKVRKALSQKDLPKFRRKYFENSQNNWPHRGWVECNEDNKESRSSIGYAPVQQHRQHNLKTSDNSKNDNYNLNMSDSLLCCVYCNAIMDITEYHALGNKCTHCRGQF